MPADARKKPERKDSQLIIRIKGSERDAFLALCEALDTSAAREIRRFIREFTLSHQDDALGASHETNQKEPDSWPRNRKSKTSKKK